MPWSCFFRPARISTALRLGRVLLALAFVFGPTLAFSQSSSDGHLWIVNYNSVQYSGASADAACSAAFTLGSPWSYAGIGALQSGGQQAPCQASNPNAPGSYYAYATAQKQSSCASGYTLQADGSCRLNCPSAGSSAPGGNTAYGTSSSQTITNPSVCVNGCAYNYTSYWTGAKPGQSGGFPVEWYGVKSSYAACSGSGMPTAVDSQPSSTCPDKTYSGTVNGQSVCVPYPTQTTGGTTNSTTTASSPAASAPAATSSSSSSSTTCDGVTCTTTTTVNVGVSGGGAGGGNGASGAAASPCASTSTSTGGSVAGGAGTCTTTTSQPQTDYCKQNPDAQQCKQNQDSASGGTDCTAPPSCSGDAISCAILSQQWNTRCDLQKSVDPSIQLGQQIQAGNDPMAAQLPTPGKADQVDLSSKLSNVDDMGIVAQCLGNIDVPLQLPGGGWNLHIDTTPLCDIGKLLGYLNMLSTLMLCAYMLKGSF